jgi:hypothetical protein
VAPNKKSSAMPQSASPDMAMDRSLRRRLLWTHAPIIPFAILIAGYIAYQLTFFALAGEYSYQTKLNVGRPVRLSFSDTPLAFLGLFLIQLSFAVFLSCWGAESAYHVIRLLKPSLGWPLRPRIRFFSIGLWCLCGGVVLLIPSVFYMLSVVLLN